MWTIQRTAAVMVLASTALAGFSSARAAEPTVKLVTEQFMVDSADPGIKLYVRNKRPEDLKQFTSEKTLLSARQAVNPVTVMPACVVRSRGVSAMTVPA
jgi:hypothetical protein